ncbi:MAG: FkbM family methyltransferase [Oligoflexus sp.]|jgi:FkbM family methyltransferase
MLFSSVCKILVRLLDLIRDHDYRRVLLQRLKLGFLRLLLPQVEVLGFRDRDGTLVFLHTRDNSITPYTLTIGNSNRKELELISAILEQEGRSARGKIFVEIGGNVGTTTVAAGKLGLFSRLLVVEPVPSNFDLLAASVAANRLQNQTHLEEKAISHQEGEANILLSEVNQGDHRVAHEGTKSGEHRQSLTILTTTLDALLRNQSIEAASIGLVWIDAQGHEGYILQGAERLLAKGQVPVLLEFCPKLLREKQSFESFLDVVNIHFRKAYVMQSRAMIPAADLRKLAQSLRGMAHLDLLLIP